MRGLCVTQPSRRADRGTTSLIRNFLKINLKNTQNTGQRAGGEPLDKRGVHRSCYVVDIYIDQIYSDESVNVNAVNSTRFGRGADRMEVEVDFHNGHTFDSRSGRKLPATAIDRLVREARRVANSPNRSGLTGNFKLTGVNTHFVPGTTQITAAQGITASNVSVTSATSLTVQLTLAPSVPANASSIVVTTGTEEADLPNGFTVQ